MKYYKYRLINFLSESQQDFADNSMFYDGNSSDPSAIQAGKPDEILQQKMHLNFRRVAELFVNAILANTSLQASTKRKGLKASGRFNLKTRSGFGMGGKASIDALDQKADFEIPFKLPSGKEVGFKVNDVDLMNLSDSDREYVGVFKNEEGKEIYLGFKLSDKGNYGFTTGGKKFNFGLNVKVKPESLKYSYNLGFDTSGYLPEKFAPKVELGLEYSEQEGSVIDITAGKDFKVDGGKFSVSATAKYSDYEKGGGVQFGYTPNKKKTKTKIDTLINNSLTSNVDRYFDPKSGRIKTVGDTDQTIIDRDIQKIRIASEKEKVDEGLVKTISRSELRKLISKLI